VTENFLFLDFGIRAGAMTAMFLVALIVLFSRAKLAFKVAISLMIMGGIGHLMAASPYIFPNAGNLQPVLKFWSQTAVLWFWFFALTLFDETIPKRLLTGLCVIFAAMWFIIWTLPEWRNAVIVPHHLLSIILIVHIIWLAISGLRDDLIESRRRLRIWLVITIGLIVLSISVSISDGYWSSRQLGWGIFSAIAILGAAIFAGLTLLGIDQNLIAEDLGRDKPLRSDDLSPSERVLNEKLLQYMESGYYTTSGLTVRAFAAELGVPDHNLRTLINGTLGYTNFSSFLNHYRIEKAKEQLAHPDFVDVPIFTLAMDLGYGSLAPFNRAFREETGMSPSDFRERAIA